MVTKVRLSSGVRAERCLEKLQRGVEKKEELESGVRGDKKEQRKRRSPRHDRPGRDTWLPHFGYQTVEMMGPKQ